MAFRFLSLIYSLQNLSQYHTNVTDFLDITNLEKKTFHQKFEELQYTSPSGIIKAVVDCHCVDEPWCAVHGVLYMVWCGLVV